MGRTTHGDPNHPTRPRHANWNTICAKCKRPICDDGHAYSPRFTKLPGFPDMRTFRVGADTPEAYCEACRRDSLLQRADLARRREQRSANGTPEFYERKKARDEAKSRELSKEEIERFQINSERARRGWADRKAREEADRARSGGLRPIHEGDFSASEVSLPSTACPRSRGIDIRYADVGENTSEFSSSYSQSEITRSGQSASQTSSVSRSATTQGAATDSGSSQRTTRYDPIRDRHTDNETSTRVSASDFSSTYARSGLTEIGYPLSPTSASGFGGSSSYGSYPTDIPRGDPNAPYDFVLNPYGRRDGQRRRSHSPSSESESPRHDRTKRRK